MYNIRQANLKDAKRIEEITHITGGCSRRDWVRQDEPWEHVRTMAEFVCASSLGLLCTLTGKGVRNHDKGQRV